MVPPSTTLNPAGTPSLAEWASTFQCAVPRACQMPFKSGLRSGVRGPLYVEAVGAAGARGGAAPRCACATPAAIAIVKASPVAPPMVAIGIFDLDLSAEGTSLHLIAKLPPRVLQRVDLGRQIRHAQDHSIPSARLLGFAAGHRARSRCSRPTEQQHQIFE